MFPFPRTIKHYISLCVGFGQHSDVPGGFVAKISLTTFHFQAKVLVGEMVKMCTTYLDYGCVDYGGTQGTRHPQYSCNMHLLHPIKTWKQQKSFIFTDHRCDGFTALYSVIFWIVTWCLNFVFLYININTFLAVDESWNWAIVVDMIDV